MNQEISLESLADGPGLLPFRLGMTRLITHYHTFLQFVELKDIDDKILELKNQLLNFKRKLDNDTYMIYELQIDYLNSKIEKVNNHLYTLKPHRTRRGLIDGLGSIIKSVTGNLDNTDALQYDNAIKILQNNNYELTQEFNNHISISKEWMVQHSNILDRLVDNQVKINKTLQLILDQDAHKDSSLIKYAKFFQHLIIITENLDEIFSELTKIESILAFIHASSVHHSMISIDVLDHMIQHLITIYGKEHILQLELREYYDIIKPGYFYSGNKIVIIFKLPIFTEDRFDLYKLSMAPNRFKQTLVPPYPLIATNSKGYVYIEAECPKYRSWYLCEEKMAHQLRQTPDCIQNLITNQSIDKTCEIATVTLSRTSMEELDEKHYIISFPNATRIHTACEKENYNVLNGTYLATIPVNCFLHTAEFTIANTYNQIKGQPLKLTKLTPELDFLHENESHIYLNSIDLRRLHDLNQGIISQHTLEPQRTSPEYTLYHTTIPLYLMLLSALALIIFIIAKRREKFQCITERLPSQDKIYAIPETSDRKKQHPSIFSQINLQK